MPPQEITAEAYEAGYVVDNVPVAACSRHLDAKVHGHDAQAHVLKMSFAAKPEFANPAGTLQGGFIAAMLDDTMGPLMLAAFGGKKLPASTDLHTTYYGAVKVGTRCYVEAKVERMGNLILFASAVMTNDKGDVIAKAIQTVRLIDLTPKA